MSHRVLLSTGNTMYHRNYVLRGESAVDRRVRMLKRALLCLPVLVGVGVLYLLPALVVGSVVP